jgi:hypothetical protein
MAMVTTDCVVGDAELGDRGLINSSLISLL